MIELRPDLVPVLKVPADYFANPGDLVQSDTKVTIDLDTDSPTYGRVFGLVAPFGRCLLDGGSDCLSVDDLKRDDPSLDTVHQGDAIDTSDGLVKVASLAGNGGHADVRWSAAQAKAFMDNPDTQVARVRYHWHPLGLVASGVANRSLIADEESVARFLASPSSLDARWMTQVRYLKDEGRYALTGAVMVVSPGFPLTRAASADLRSDAGFWLVDGEARVAADSPALNKTAQEAAMKTTEDAAPGAAIAKGDSVTYDGKSVKVMQLVTIEGAEMAVLDNYLVVPVGDLEGPLDKDGEWDLSDAVTASACACSKTAADHAMMPTDVVPLPEEGNPDVAGLIGALAENVQAILDIVQRIDSNGRTAAARLMPELVELDALAARVAGAVYTVDDAPAFAANAEVTLPDGSVGVATYALGKTAQGKRLYEVKVPAADGSLPDLGVIYGEDELAATGRAYSYAGYDDNADGKVDDTADKVVSDVEQAPTEA